MTEQKTSRDWSAQRELDLPAELVETWRQTTARRGHIGATLLYGAVVRAAEYARDGRTDMLPAKSGAPTTRGGQLPVKWTQRSEESKQMAALLKAAGSSVRAVVAAYMQAYSAADGDLMELSWPRRESSAAA